MRYVFDGQYREFRGYVFAHGNPVTISDGATLEAIKKDSTFREYHEKVQGQETAEKVLDANACPKCGKVFIRGRAVHIKYCKGKK